MTRRSLSPPAPPALAVTVGATTPNPAVTGALIWSTTHGRYLTWNGTSWAYVTSLATVTPPAIAAAAAQGTSNDAAHGDHTHAHGAQTDPTNHAVATGFNAGFQSAADKAKSDQVAGFTTITAGAADVGKAPLLDATGDLDVSVFPAVIRPVTVGLITADTSNAAATAANVTGGTLSLPVVGTYEFEWLIRYGTAASTTGIRFALTGPTFSTMNFVAEIWTTATTMSAAEASAYATLVGATSGPGAAFRTALIRGWIVTTATGTLQLQIASSAAASAVTVKAGSLGKVCRLG